MTVNQEPVPSYFLSERLRYLFLSQPENLQLDYQNGLTIEDLYQFGRKLKKQDDKAFTPVEVAGILMHVFRFKIANSPKKSNQLFLNIEDVEHPYDNLSDNGKENLWKILPYEDIKDRTYEYMSADVFLPLFVRAIEPTLHSDVNPTCSVKEIILDLLFANNIEKGLPHYRAIIETINPTNRNVAFYKLFA